MVFIGLKIYLDFLNVNYKLKQCSTGTYLEENIQKHQSNIKYAKVL